MINNDDVDNDDNYDDDDDNDDDNDDYKTQITIYNVRGLTFCLSHRLRTY